MLTFSAELRTSFERRISMKYIADPEWKLAEKQGNLTTAANLLLQELKYNCNRLPKDSAEYELATSLCELFAYVPLLSQVDISLFSNIKNIRKDVKNIIKHYTFQLK